MSEDKFRYLVIATLLVIANYVHRLARHERMDTDLKDMQDLIAHLAEFRDELDEKL